MRFSMFSCLAQLSLVLGTATTAFGAYIGSRQSGTCNGHAELCDRSYGNITFIGAHNSYAVGVNNLATNQDYDVTQQLNDGVRLIQMQTHNKTGVIQLCHTSCFLFDGGSLKDYLKKIKTWMDSNTNDVVTLLITNPDGFPATQFASIFAETGMDKLSYSPPTATVASGDWPTLSTLITAGTRLVTFIDAHADFEQAPYLINEFTSVWETAFDVLTTFDCEVNRTKGDSSTQLYAINHFLDKPALFGQPAPFKEVANVTNAATGNNSLGDHMSLCQGQWSRSPNFVLVDFYEFGGGSVFEVAAGANGVTYNPTTPIATPLPDTSAGVTSSSTANAAAVRLSGSPLTPAHVVMSLAVATGVLAGALSIF